MTQSREAERETIASRIGKMRTVLDELAREIELAKPIDDPVIRLGPRVRYWAEAMQQLIQISSYPEAKELTNPISLLSVHDTRAMIQSLVQASVSCGVQRIDNAMRVARSPEEKRAELADAVSCLQAALDEMERFSDI